MSNLNVGGGPYVIGNTTKVPQEQGGVCIRAAIWWQLDPCIPVHGWGFGARMKYPHLVSPRGLYPAGRLLPICDLDRSLFFLFQIMLKSATVQA